MSRMHPLQAAAGAYAGANWQEAEWREFGRETGTSDIISVHPRLYRSLSFGDDDYPDAALAVIGLVLEEGIEPGTGEAGKMDLLADAMPDLPQWVSANGAARTKRLFDEYLSARATAEIPGNWLLEGPVEEGTVQAAELDSSAATSVTPEHSTDDWGGNWQQMGSTPTWSAEPTTTSSSWSAEPATNPVTSSPGPETTWDWPETTFSTPTIFVVHGHDEPALHSIQLFVHETTGLMPKSLAQEPGSGQTIIEKFEKHGGDSSYVIVLMTPDDMGQTRADYQAELLPKPRARQNVVLELGYFIGKIGRKNIIVVKGDVESPSDLAGLSHVAYPESNWKHNLRTELVAWQLVK